jgi:gluconolactonase
MLKNVLYPLVACASLCSAIVSVQANGIFDVQVPSEFSQVVDTNTAVLTINATNTLGSTILEGLTWVPGNPGYLMFSTFNNNNMGDPGAGLRKLVLPNTVTTNLTPPAYTVYNGSSLDNQERFISCQAGGAAQRVVMITNGVVTTLCTSCNGKKFYSPNDVVVKSDGTVWFTDPAFNGTTNDGTAGYATGHNVYCFNPTNGNATCTAVITFSYSYRPNGLCFSPDESLFYLADYGNHRILVYSVSSGNTLSAASTFATLPNNYSPDGIRCDADGRIYSSSGGGVYIYMPNGTLIGRIVTTAGVNNLCFGGADGRTLFIGAAPNILSIPLKVTGTPWIKKLQVLPTDGTAVNVAWPWPSTGFQLQSRPAIATGNWSQVQYAPTVSNGLNLIQFDPSTNSAAFFRLCLPSP